MYSVLSNLGRLHFKFHRADNRHVDTTLTESWPNWAKQLLSNLSWIFSSRIFRMDCPYLECQSSPRPATQAPGERGAWVAGRGDDWHFRLGLRVLLYPFPANRDVYRPSIAQETGLCVEVYFCPQFPTTSTSDQTTSVAYCERVTKKECEEISRITSQRSLRDLLDTIIENEAITEKGRQKQLKQVSRVEACHTRHRDRHRGNTYLTSLQLVSVHRHRLVAPWKSRSNFTSIASSIFVVHITYLKVSRLVLSFLAQFWRLQAWIRAMKTALEFVILWCNVMTQNRGDRTAPLLTIAQFPFAHFLARLFWIILLGGEGFVHSLVITTPSFFNPLGCEQRYKGERLKGREGDTGGGGRGIRKMGKGIRRGEDSIYCLAVTGAL